MSYYVQCEIVKGVTHHIGWFDVDLPLEGKFVDGWELRQLWPNTILTEKSGADGKEIRSVATDAASYTIRAMLIASTQEKKQP